ncbi:MAG: LEA type 2 family protein [Moraxellaceae bacterium]|nr:LEA type 2 family protein [Pseudobdellovibrionaceae bacterium]
MKIYFLIFSLSFSTLVGCALLTQNLKDPEVKFLDLLISQISADTVDLDLKLNVKNPNDVDIKVSKITYGLTLAGQPMTNGIFAKEARVGAHENLEVIVPLKFKYSTIANIVTSLLNRNLSKTYELKGAVDLGWLSIPFTQKGEIKLQ